MVLTGYIHLLRKTEHVRNGGAFVSTECGAKDRPYVWGKGGLRISTLPSLVECPACRTTDAFWDKAGEVARVGAGKQSRWAS